VARKIPNPVPGEARSLTIPKTQKNKIPNPKVNQWPVLKPVLKPGLRYTF